MGHRSGEIYKGSSSMYSYFSDFRVPQYSICSEELEKITCGSHEARRALEQGITTISEISDDLWEPLNSGNRVAWLEEQYRLAQTALEDEEGMSDKESLRPLSVNVTTPGEEIYALYLRRHRL